MSLYAPSSESNRFTIADYQYDRSDLDHDMPGPSSSGSRVAQYDEPLPTSKSSRSNKSGGRLQLHDPAHPPSIPMSSMGSAGSSGGPSKASGSLLDRPLPEGIRPLPPVPIRSASSSSSFSSRDAVPSHEGSSIHPLPPVPIMAPVPRHPEANYFHSGQPRIDQSPISLASTAAPFRHSPSPSPLPMLNRQTSVFSDVSTHQVHGYAYKTEKPGEEFVNALNHGVAGVQKRWWRRIIPDSTACKLLLFTVILETVIDIAIEANILWRFNKEVDDNDTSQTNFERKRRLPIYLVIYGLAHLWQLVLVVIAVINRNTVQVIAATIFNFAFLGYAVIQIYELRQILGDLKTGLTEGSSESLLTLPLDVLTGVVIGVVSAGSLALLVLAYFIRREFGWQRYRFLGADLRIRRYYFWFQVYECVCYFSAFFCAGFGIQFIWLVLQKTDVEYIITWIAFPLLILLLVFGRFAAKFENLVSMCVFMLGLLVGCAYFIFKLVRIWQEADTTYVSLTKSLTVFDALSLASLMACFALGIVVWRNFGKGLREAIVRRIRGKAGAEEYGLEETKSKGDESVSVGEKALRRISID